MIPGFQGLFLKNPGQNNLIFQVKCCHSDPDHPADLERKISAPKHNIS